MSAFRAFCSLIIKLFINLHSICFFVYVCTLWGSYYIISKARKYHSILELLHSFSFMTPYFHHVMKARLLNKRLGVVFLYSWVCDPHLKSWPTDKIFNYLVKYFHPTSSTSSQLQFQQKISALIVLTRHTLILQIISKLRLNTRLPSSAVCLYLNKRSKIKRVPFKRRYVIGGRNFLSYTMIIWDEVIKFWNIKLWVSRLSFSPMFTFREAYNFISHH